MAKLAIKGHETKGDEVIKILKMLGGRTTGYSGRGSQHYYYIDNFGNIMGTVEIPSDITFKVFTLEKFLEKYPYKVGDKVNYVKYNDGYPSIYTIQKMWWTGVTIAYLLDSSGLSALTKDLQPYKEEAMEKEISGEIVNRFICLEGYDFYDDKGNIIDTKEITMKHKQPKYPKTFVECAKILDCFCAAHIDGYKCELLENFQELIICRDAYRKIAGDWEPNFTNDEEKFIIANYYGKLCTAMALNRNRVLVFPTEEMRDAFYENFKDLIEECKELL
jgi:hypothetical protein